MSAWTTTTAAVASRRDKPAVTGPQLAQQPHRCERQLAADDAEDLVDEAPPQRVLRRRHARHQRRILQGLWVISSRLPVHHAGWLILRCRATAKKVRDTCASRHKTAEHTPRSPTYGPATSKALRLERARCVLRGRVAHVHAIGQCAGIARRADACQHAHLCV